MVTWEEIRAMWVNGETEETRLKLSELERIELFNVILQAVQTSVRLNHQSGDLTDLREILSSVIEIERT